MIDTIHPLPVSPEPQVDAIGDWSGLVHQVRRLAARTFIKLWLPRGLLQVVSHAEVPEEVRPGATIRVRGQVVAATLRDATLYWRELELTASEIEVLASPSAEAMPFDLTRPELTASAETRLDHRPISLRHPKIRAVFVVQAALVRGFRSHLDGMGFTEIHSPKLGSEAAEGGAKRLRARLLRPARGARPVSSAAQGDVHGGVRSGVRGGPGVPGRAPQHASPPQRVHLAGRRDGTHRLVPRGDGARGGADGRDVRRGPRALRPRARAAGRCGARGDVDPDDPVRRGQGDHRWRGRRSGAGRGACPVGVGGWPNTARSCCS